MLQNGQPVSLPEFFRLLHANGLRGSHAARQQESRASGGGESLDGNTLSFPATLTAAAPWQSVRHGNMAIKIEKADLRYRRPADQTRFDILFLLDTSRSQGAERRLSYAKSAVQELLSQAYCSRDRAELITFGNKKAEIRMPLTRSVSFAAQCLQDIPASGNTPLGMGLQTARGEILRLMRNPGAGIPVLVVLTDGRANYDVRPGTPMDLACADAAWFRMHEICTVVVDTERGPVRMGLAKKLADWAGAAYLRMK